MTQDPLGLAGGVNLYAYAGNNPVSFSDPYGLCTPWPWCHGQAAAEFWAARSASSTSSIGRLGNNLMGAAATLISDKEHAAATALTLGTAGAYALSLRAPTLAVGAAGGGTAGPLAADKIDDIAQAAFNRGVNAGQRISALSQSIGSLRLGQSNALNALEQGLTRMNLEYGQRITIGGDTYLTAARATNGIVNAIRVAADGSTSSAVLNIGARVPEVVK